MTWPGTKVLVTGAGGFVGSHLVETLVARGADVRAFVRYTSCGGIGSLTFLPREVLQGVEIRRGDLRDSSAILQAVKGCEAVFHLGALTSIPYSYQHPREVVETNLLGTLNVLEAARRTPPRSVVHVSTSEVYGTAQTVPINEQHPLRAQSPYAASKVGADQLAESYHRCFGVPVTTIRPFNIYGPRQSARAVIPTIMMQALAGSAIRLGSLYPTRDFTFVRDTVQGFLLAAATPAAIGHEVNLGSEDEIAIGDLAKKILALSGRSVPIITEERRTRPTASEVGRLHADGSLAHRLLGWRSTVSLEEGLRQTLAWMREHLELYHVDEYSV